MQNDWPFLAWRDNLDVKRYAEQQAQNKRIRIVQRQAELDATDPTDNGSSGHAIIVHNLPRKWRPRKLLRVRNKRMRRLLRAVRRVLT